MKVALGEAAFREERAYLPRKVAANVLHVPKQVSFVVLAWVRVVAIVDYADQAQGADLHPQHARLAGPLSHSAMSILHPTRIWSHVYTSGHIMEPCAAQDSAAALYVTISLKYMHMSLRTSSMVDLTPPFTLQHWEFDSNRLLESTKVLGIKGHIREHAILVLANGVPPILLLVGITRRSTVIAVFVQHVRRPQLRISPTSLGEPHASKLILLSGRLTV